MKTHGVSLPEVKRYHQYWQDRWSVEDGLLQVVAASIAQDSQGYIWVGSQVGLSRFDGVKFTHFTPEEYPEINGYINKILSDSSGHLWVATTNGLSVRQKNLTFQQVKKPNNYKKLNNSKFKINNMIELADKRILVSSNHGIFTVNNKNLTYQELVLKKHKQIATFGLFADEQSIWLGHLGFITEIRNGTEKIYSLGKESQSVKVEHITQYQNKILLGTTDGIYQLINGKLVKHTQHPVLSNVPIESMMVDSRQELWIGTNLGLFHLINSNVYEYIDNNNPKAFKVIRSMLEDKEGNLWLGSYVHGIARLRQGSTYNYSIESGLTDPLVWSVFPRDDNSLWIGTNSGLNKFENESFSLEVSSEKLPHPVVYTLFEDPSQLVIGTRTGIAFYKNKKITMPSKQEAIMHSHIRSIISDDNTGYYFGTNNGLFHLTNNQFKQYNLATNGDNLSIRHIIKSSQNNLLLGTTKGIYQFSSGVIEKVYPQQSEENIDITFIYQNTDDNSLIVGTASSGLLYNKNSQWHLFNKKNSGLPTPGGFFIVKDANDIVWISSYNGMYRFPYNNIRLLINHKIDNLGTQYILSDTPQSSGAEKSDCCTGAGTAKGILNNNALILPSRTGLIMLDTNHISTNLIAPFSIIERIKHSNKWHTVINSKEKRVLNNNARDIVFEFTAPTFQDPQGIFIQYQLSGYDEQWKKLEDVSKRQVSYTNLPAGNYQFKIKASNNSNIWQKYPTTLSFQILPYFYETWWFILTIIVSVIYLLKLWYKKRVLFFKNQQLILEAEVKKRTQELSIANKKLTNISYTDPLTGLKNRRYLHEQISKDIAYFNRLKASPANADSTIVLMMIDIDHFKMINDTFGHSIGDKVITKLSEVLLTELREDDYIVRWGGEEFLIVARAVERENSDHIARRLCKKIEATNFDNELKAHKKITCSIGFALLPFFEDSNQVDLSWEEVVDIADKALYLVKQNGRNGWATYISSQTHKAKSLKESINFEEFTKQNKLKLNKSW